MLKIIYSQTNKDSGEFLLKSLKERDKTQKHIVFTPDRANLIYQNQIFDLIDEECLFDVDVTTISRFASRFVGKENVLSKQGGVAIVKKILLENKNDFLIFGKSCGYKGFALSVFETLCMFKSCRISPNDISLSDKNTLFDKKLHDLKIVYEKYECYLQNEFTDSFNILNLCASKINRENFADTNFYFVGFEDITKQIYFLIEKMMKCAKNVFVATCYSKKGVSNNYNIYDNLIMSSLVDIAKTNGVSYELINCYDKKENEKKILKDNLFAFNFPNKYKSSNISIFTYDNRIDEIRNVVNYIRYNVVKNGLKYGDFTILVPKIDDYKNGLQQEFKNFEMTCYFDDSGVFSENVVVRWVLSLIKICDDYREIFSLINFPFYDISEKSKNAFLDRVEKFGLSGKTLIECEELQSDFTRYLKEYIIKSKEVKTVQEYVEVLKEAIKTFALDKIGQLHENFYEKGLITEYKKLPQCIDRLNRVLEELVGVLGSYECSHKTFAEIFEDFVNSITLTQPPIVADSVFVGEIEKSFVEDSKYLIVLGCNEGVVPNYSSELGIISDKEIELMPSNARLSPTIAQINRRKKFKVFENLLAFKDKLVLSYITASNGNKLYSSSFIEDIKNLFDLRLIDGSKLLNPIYANMEEFNEVLAMYNNLSQKSIDRNFAYQLKYFQFLHENKAYMDYLSLLGSLASEDVLKDYNFKNEVAPLGAGAFLTEKTIGVSEIERFNNCPYKHFVEYGLKIRGKENGNFEALDNGQIIHEFLKLVVPKLSKKKYLENEIKNIVEVNLNEVLSKEIYKHLTSNKENIINIKSLKSECGRIIKALVYQLNNSSFEPIRFEQPFKYEVGGVDGEENIALVGVVDRIDRWQDYYTIIDYKTGSSKMDNFDEVKSGEKWQLVVYMYVMSKGKLNPAGCYYMPIKNDFVTKEKYNYQLQGVTLKDNDVFSALDNNLKELNHASKIVKLETGGKGLKENAYYKNLCLNENEITKLNAWVLSQVKEKIRDIKEGIITPYPMLSGGRSACDYCKYIGLCNFNKVYGNKENVATKCKNIGQLLGEVEDE